MLENSTLNPIAAIFVFSLLKSLRPNAGSWYLVLYLYLLPGIFSRAFKMINQVFFKKTERRYRWSFSVLAVICGLLSIPTISGLPQAPTTLKL